MKPILFNTREVRAVLDGRMTAVRRPIFPKNDLRPFSMKNSPYGWWFRGRAYRNWNDAMWEPQGVMSLCRYKPGDILYVRETWCKGRINGENERYFYKADGDLQFHCGWCPSTNMPKEAARIFLRVTDVKVDRLQCITRDEALREGANPACAYIDYKASWNKPIKKEDLLLYGWDANPWVEVTKFVRISKEEALKNG
jgi:hypothetical protein